MRKRSKGTECVTGKEKVNDSSIGRHEKSTCTRKRQRKREENSDEVRESRQLDTNLHEQFYENFTSQEPCWSHVVDVSSVAMETHNTGLSNPGKLEIQDVYQPLDRGTLKKNHSDLEEHFDSELIDKDIHDDLQRSHGHYQGSHGDYQPLRIHGKNNNDGVQLDHTYQAVTFKDDPANSFESPTLYDNVSRVSETPVLNEEGDDALYQNNQSETYETYVTFIS
jgi:hypothetical protein